MWRAVLPGPPRSGSTQRSHGSRQPAPALELQRPQGPGPEPPPPPERAPPRPAGSSRARLGGGWDGPACPRPTPASPSSLPCGSARLYLNLWWFNALLQRHLQRERESACTLFSVLRKNFSVVLFILALRHRTLSIPVKKSEGETLRVKGSFSWPQTNGLISEPQN